MKDGIVYLNPKALNAETPIHEFAHLWNDHIRENEPKLYAEGVSLVKHSPYW